MDIDQRVPGFLGRVLDASARPAAPGPSRILIAISAPLSGGGQVLNYERELHNVHAAVHGARQSRAQVRVVHFATTAEINTELRQEPVHVLHPFVGRRREQRRWPAELVSSGAAGLVLHGIGGVGKTTLATKLARRIVEREPARLGTEGGELGVDQVLGALAMEVRRRLG